MPIAIAQPTDMTRPTIVMTSAVTPARLRLTPTGFTMASTCFRNCPSIIGRGLPLERAKC